MNYLLFALSVASLAYFVACLCGSPETVWTAASCVIIGLNASGALCTGRRLWREGAA